MIYLIISILASVSISVLLKLARKSQIDIAQAVAVNYPVAIVLSVVFLQPNFEKFEAGNSWWLFVSLGILLPFIFVMMGRAVATAGIVKSDAAQRLSLLITLLISFLVWKEPASPLKIWGVSLALVALIFILMKKTEDKKSSSLGIFYLFMVWMGYGVIDLLFKLISKTSGNTFSTTLTISFLIAAVLIFIWLGFQKSKINRNSIIGGILLGLLNFTNIYTYITAHKHLGESPSVVFTGMNIGVIGLGTLIGLFVFKEKLSRINFFGIILAVIAIILLFIEL
ncbi:MAG: EamA/RhaT family transporter [Flavobacteriaceae bacterium]|nr:EamA/RhaT family transporter [Flavobacteriaceae bacterium]